MDLPAVLEEYVRKEHQGASPFLFPARRRPAQPAPAVARTMLDRCPLHSMALCNGSLCQRAGLRAFTPHQFRFRCSVTAAPRRMPRHFLVNTLMQQGNRIECVARWLGHQSPAVTFRHYWTDGPHQVLPAAFVAGNETRNVNLDHALYQALEAKVVECERLEAQLKGQEHKDPSPLPHHTAAVALFS